MKSSLRAASTALLAAGSLSTANAGSSYVAPTIDLTNKAVLEQLCKDTNNISGITIDGKDLCQVSPDGGKTWIWIPVGLAALLGGGAYFIRRKRDDVTPAPGTPGAPDDTPAPVPGEVDETPHAPEVVVEPEEAPEELVSEESDKTPEEIIIERAKKDPRFTFEGDVMKSIMIGPMKIDDLTKWTLESATMPNPTIHLMAYTFGKERLVIASESDESAPINITHYLNADELNKDVITSFSPVVCEIVDDTGGTICHVPGGTLIGYSVLTVDADGMPKVYGGGKYDSSDTLIEEYDFTGKVKGAPDVIESPVTDILAPDTSPTAPAPVPSALEAPATDTAPTPAPAVDLPEATVGEETPPAPSSGTPESPKGADPTVPTLTDTVSGTPESPVNGVAPVAMTPVPPASPVAKDDKSPVVSPTEAPTPIPSPTEEPKEEAKPTSAPVASEANTTQTRQTWLSRLIPWNRRK